MIDKLIRSLSEHILNPVIILLFAIALIVFIWGLVVFIRNAPDEKALEQAKRHIVYGLLGMFIMVSAFGIVKLILGTFGIPEMNVNDIKK